MSTNAKIEAAKERWGLDGRERWQRYKRMHNGSVAQAQHNMRDDCRILADACCAIQQQPVNERLLEAAKHTQEKLVGKGVGEELDAAIEAAEVEIENRRKPVTEDWLKNLPGWEVKQPSLVPTYVHKELYAQMNFWDETGPILLFGCTQVNDPQQWHVLDLMRVIGGAKRTLNEHSDLSRRSSKTLVTWWLTLNEWGWPKEFGEPEPRRSTNARRLVIMNKILKTLGYKAIKNQMCAK